MKKAAIFGFLFLAFIICFFSSAVFSATTVCKWKDNKAGAFSMSFDDSMYSHITYVIPNLISRGLVGTFFVNPGWRYGFGITEWESSALRMGMDFADHSMHHLGAKDMAEADYEIGETARIIWSVRAPGKSKLLLFLGGGGTTWPSGYGSILPVYNCIEGRGGHGGGADTRNLTYAQMVDYVQQAISSAGWMGFCSHGVGPSGEYLVTPESTFIPFLDYLVSVSSQIWEGANTDVQMYDTERSAAVVTPIEETSVIRFNLTSGVDPALYDYPLTLITDVPGGWICCKITQGDLISIKPVDSGKVMYEAVPNRGEVKLEDSAMDTTAPGVPDVRDGTGNDMDLTPLTTQISANWDACADAESGISKYLYKVGTTPGGSQVFDWVDNGTFTYVTTSRTNLALSRGVTYYMTVKAVNGVGFESNPGVSNGQRVETAPGYVKFFEGFERGNLDRLDNIIQGGANTIAVSQEAAYQGTYGLKCHIQDRSTVSIVKTNVNSLSSSFVKFYFKLSPDFNMPKITQAGGENKLLRLMGLTDTNGWPAGSVYIANVDSGFNIYTYFVDNRVGSLLVPILDWTGYPTPKGGCIPISTGTWHCIDLHTKSDINRGGVELWVDGVKVFSYLYRYTDGINGRNLEIGADKMCDNISGDIYFDNITLSDCLYTPAGAPPVIDDSTPPEAPAVVRDGTGPGGDMNTVSSGTQLSANWDASSDPESGIWRYWYAIGTSTGQANVAGWTDNGLVTSVTKTGLTLTYGQMYYFSVKAENGAALKSIATNSNGQVCISSTNIIQPGDKVKVWPNPFVPKPGQLMRFDNLVSNSTIKIYTLSGRLVNSLIESGGGANWDGKNIDGKTIAPGLYVYVVTDGQGTKRTGKIAISK